MRRCSPTRVPARLTNVARADRGKLPGARITLGRRVVRQDYRGGEERERHEREDYFSHLICSFRLPTWREYAGR